MCQCPERGDLHFYFMVLVVYAVVLCQCPERGDLHFYKYFTMITGAKDFVCQCPERGDLHFYCLKNSCVTSSHMSVNALKGATSISTLASGNPHK